MTRQRPVPGAEDDVLGAAPAYAEWLQEGVVLRDRSDKLAQQVAAAQAAQAKATEDHAAAVQAAVRAGERVPETPVPMDFRHLDAARAVQDRDEQRHRELRATVVAGVADQVLPQLRARERDRQEKLVAIAHQLDQISSEHHRDVAVARDVLTCQDEVGHLTDRPTRSDRVPTPDVVELLAAATSGRSLLDPAPLPPRNVDTDGMVQVDRSHVWQQHAREPMER